MAAGIDPQEQLAEIRGYIAEARSVWTGGGIVGIVGGCATAVAIVLALTTRLSQPLIWASHNAVLWAFVLIETRREERREGRVSLRGRYVLRLWAMVTLAVWLHSGLLCSFAVSPNMGAALLSTFLGIGIFATGLLSESIFSQIVGVVLALAGVGIAVMAPPPLGCVLILVSIAVGGIVWGLGSFLARGEK